MTREEAKEHLPAIKAFAEGAIIQMYSASYDEWKDVKFPTFSGGNKWRVKDEPIECIMWVKDGVPITPSEFAPEGKEQDGYKAVKFREVTND